MTEQEASAFVERLTRIWAPDDPVGLKWWLSSEGELDFYAPIANNLVVSIFQGLYFKITLDKLPPTPGKIHGCLVWEDGAINTSAQMGERFRMSESFCEFARDWLPFFRRSCWLSGCPIEATAHEKVEWIQGFTREEIEAWDLKI